MGQVSDILELVSHECADIFGFVLKVKGTIYSRLAEWVEQSISGTYK